MEVREAFAPLTIQGEPHCSVCGGVMRCVDSETYGTDRVELRWVCRTDGTRAITTESVWRDPDPGGTAARLPDPIDDEWEVAA